MFKSEFKRIAEKENGKFYFEDKDISIGLGVRSPNVIYIIKFEYNNSYFTIYNSFRRHIVLHNYRRI